MYLGKPVIATSYSGNMDFMNVNNSFLVKYDLVETREDYGAYKKGTVWADPSIENAADLMQLVYNQNGKALQVGRRGQSDIHKNFSPEVTGKEIFDRLERMNSLTSKSLK